MQTTILLFTTSPKRVHKFRNETYIHIFYIIHWNVFKIHIRDLLLWKTQRWQVKYPIIFVVFYIYETKIAIYNDMQCIIRLYIYISPSIIKVEEENMPVACHACPCHRCVKHNEISLCKSDTKDSSLWNITPAVKPCSPMTQQGEGTSLKFTFLLKHMSIIINYCS